MLRNVFHILLLLAISSSSFAQIKILFDATKAETVGNADWVIDEDNGTPQRIPTPAQSQITAATPETFWTGALSYWGIDCVNKGYTVETLPSNGKITYGTLTNAQDLSNYKAFVVDEPNIIFTAAEKTAMLNFVYNGGGLFIISDHSGADRNNDGNDPPHIWNDFFRNNGSGNTNPFGIMLDSNDVSPNSTFVLSVPANDTILHGPMGNATRLKYSQGTSMTINKSANPTVKGYFFTTAAGVTGSTNVLWATARYGNGKVVVAGDSSPFDDSTGTAGNTLYNGYTGDAGQSHLNLIVNSTIWLVSDTYPDYTFTGNGNWSTTGNWMYNLVPPATLPKGSKIYIDNTAGGQCLLNVTQHIATGASIIVNANKSLVVPGLLQVN